MKILEKHIAYTHYRDLNMTYSYTVDEGVRIKRSIRITISGKLLDPLSDKEASILLQKLSLVLRGKNETAEEQ